MILRASRRALALVCLMSQALPAQALPAQALRSPRRRPPPRIVVPPVRVSSRPATSWPLADSVRLAAALARAALPGVDRPHPTETVVPGTQDRRATDGSADRRFTVVSFVGSRYDNNVNRDQEPIASVGVVSGVGVRAHSGGRRPWFDGEYDVAWHRYSATERFNRVSQRLRLTASARLARFVDAALVSEGSLKGSAEDRDVADQFALLPRLDLRLSGRHRLRLVGAHRWRRYALAPEQDATNDYAAVEVRQRGADETTWEGEARVERNAAAGSRYVYQRLTVSTAYARPVGARSFLDLELRYRVQHYPRRFVDVGDIEVPRRDARLEPSIGWRWRLGRTDLEVRYEPERRWSNDPDKAFVQHLATMGISRRW